MNLLFKLSFARLVALSTLLLPCSPDLAAQEKPLELILAEGTPITVVTTNEISSKTAQAGESVTFKVDEDLSLKGHVVIAKGTPVNGSVINAEPAGRYGNSGKLGVAVQETTTADGQPIRLRAAKGNEGDDKTVSTGFLAGVSPFFLLRKGGDARIVEGTRIVVYVAETKYFRVEGSTLVASDPPAADVPTSERTANPSKDTWPIVFIYRPEKWLGYAQAPSVFVDDTELARMDNGCWFAVRLPPGKHMVHMTNKKRSFVIDMGVGERYYFRVAIESGFTRQHGKLTLEDAAIGQKEIKKLVFIPENKIKATALVERIAQ